MPCEPEQPAYGTDLIRQLITNHFMHFLALDRTDPKKFQVLQIIASLLEWPDGKSCSRMWPCQRSMAEFSQSNENRQVLHVQVPQTQIRRFPYRREKSHWLSFGPGFWNKKFRKKLQEFSHRQAAPVDRSHHE